MSRAEAELSTADWKRVFTQARELGVLQLGLSGGEPLVRKDLEELVAHARGEGLYSTLVTSALGLTRKRAERLKAAGIDHVQISFQDTDAANADRIAGIKLGRQKTGRGQAGEGARPRVLRERRAASRQPGPACRDHRDGRLPWEPIGWSCANTQYYGWALKNRDMLMPTRDQVERSRAIAEAAIAKYAGQDADPLRPA